MKQIWSVFLILAIVISPCLAGAANWDVAVENKIGGATYKEKYSNVDSDWNAFYYEGVISANYFKEKGLVGRLDFGIPITPSAEETWNVSDIKYQTNDMSFWGMESNVELGYGIPIIVDKMSLAVIGVYGFNFIRFTRTNFVILNSITSTAIVDEDYWVHHLDVGGKLFYDVTDRLKLNLKGLFGFVVYNSAHNSVLGTVEGDGGYLLKVDTDLDYDLYKGWVLGLAGFFTWQFLEGGTSGNLVWPDNDLYTYGGNIAIKYRF